LGLERGVHQPAFATFPQLVHAEDRPVLAAIREAFQRGDPRPMARFRINRPDGEPRVLESVVSLLSDQAEPSSRVLIIFRDVTELHAAEQRQRDLERQLQHSQKLDALGTLAGGIAHDLNNTLVPIMGLAKITMRHVPSGSRGHDNLATILRASQRARDLVGQILAFSRHEKPTRERVDLAALTSEALAMLRASVPATARIAESIEAVPPVLGDAGQLHQVIVNLVVNAAQAIGGDMGTITVALGAEARALPEGAGAAPPGPCVHLSVRDTGCGMNEATLARLRPVLHHQAGRRRHRPRPLGRARHRRPAWRSPDRGEPPGAGYAFRRLPAGARYRRRSAAGQSGGNGNMRPLHRSIRPRARAISPGSTR
jgi:signal transduction histidine kinase